LITVLAILAAVAYAVPLLTGLVRRSGLPEVRPAWAALGVPLHLAALGVEWAEIGALPFSSMRWGLAALALWVVLGFGFFSRRPRMNTLGSLLLGLGLVLLCVAQVAPGADGDPGIPGAWFVAHFALLLAGMAGLAVSFGLSALFLVVRDRLKRKQLRGIGRLPTLDRLDQLNYRSMAIGFVALTAGMAVGGMWAATHPGANTGPDVTVWGTVLVWLWYAAGLHVRLVSGWRGRLAALFGVGGFVLLLVVFSIAGLVLRGWH
jgi:ABC-type transport system involved in cytochrome c biogenesis permease subunit